MKRFGLVVAVALLAGCGSGSGSAAPSGDAGASFALRATPTQAIAPEFRFSWTPYAFITDAGIVVTPGAVPAIFPGPLLPNLQGAPISEAGFDRIVERARSLGLLEGNGDFMPSDGIVGGLSGIIELRVDGALREITGDPNARIQCITTPCDPTPGTPEAFGTFWGEIGDLRSLVGEELGSAGPYQPEGYALLIGVEPPDDGGMQRHVVAWPLAVPLADTGLPIGDDALPRCATVRGADATVLEAAFVRSNQLTLWADAQGDPVAIAVRPLLPGDDVCKDLFGIDA